MKEAEERVIDCPHCGAKVTVTRTVEKGKVIKVGVCKNCEKEVRIERDCEG